MCKTLHGGHCGQQVTPRRRVWGRRLDHTFFAVQRSGGLLHVGGHLFVQAEDGVWRNDLRLRVPYRPSRNCLRWPVGRCLKSLMKRRMSKNCLSAIQRQPNSRLTCSWLVPFEQLHNFFESCHTWHQNPYNSINSLWCGLVPWVPRCQGVPDQGSLKTYYAHKAKRCIWIPHRRWMLRERFGQVRLSHTYPPLLTI